MKFFLIFVAVCPLLTQSVVADEKKAKPGVLKPTHAEVSYGSDKMNVLDFWKAEGDGPRPLLVYIHGGGWIGGDKKRSSRDVQPFLDKGISYAAVNYRLTGQASLPAPVHDAARAIQFLRSKAAEWNIKTSRIALTGGSAGACTSMWLLLPMIWQIQSPRTRCFASQLELRRRPLPADRLRLTRNRLNHGLVPTC